METRLTNRAPYLFRFLFRVVFVLAVALPVTFIIQFIFLNTAIAQATPFKGFDSLLNDLQIRSYYQLPQSKNTVKIAILDNGFAGYQNELGHTLPANTIYHAGPVAPPAKEETHGLQMAQIVSGILTGNGTSKTFPFELHLYPAYGYSNLTAAVDDLSKQNIQIVLYSQVWEYGGFGEGRGFINSLVSKAVNAGIIWVNASGNYELTTFIGPLIRTPDDWAKLPGPNQSVQLRCEQNPHAPAPAAAGCHLRLVLAWNDFHDDVNIGTDKDLDLVLTDDTLNIVQSAALTQKPDFPEGQQGFSKYPREILEAQLKPGLYYARVKMRSQNFEKSDQLRLTATGDGIKMLNRTQNDSLLNPADHPGVVTIGASDSELSSRGYTTAIRNGETVSVSKPDLVISSLIHTNDGDTKGSSNSAAIVAGLAGIFKSLNPALNPTDLINLLTPKNTGGQAQPNPASPGSPVNPGGPVNPSGQGSQGIGNNWLHGLSLSDLGFGPAAGSCFVPTASPFIPAQASALFQIGSVSVATNTGTKIFIDRDPISVTGIPRVRFDDVYAMGPAGFSLFPRSALLPYGFVEVVQIPKEAVVCQMQ